MARTKLKDYTVSIRMYCLGTGDCFIYKFLKGNKLAFTMMIDCGSCQGERSDFLPYVTDLVKYVENKIDLLIITHEHNDHVNGFAKCKQEFANPELVIKEAWMAWTEDPADPEDRAKDLKKMRKDMRAAFQLGMKAIKSKGKAFLDSLSNDFYYSSMVLGQEAFIDGLNTLAAINLSKDENDALGVSGASLPGMNAIKEILALKETPIKYVHPGQTQTIKALPGLRFHILGPPYDREAILKNEREGKDVFKRHLQPYAPSLAVKALLNMDNPGQKKDLPFGEEYIYTERSKPSLKSTLINQIQVNSFTYLPTKTLYDEAKESWRKIDTEWLYSIGTLAIRLNSHINNTSVVLAIESTDSGDTLLLPGDAEFGSWESWFKISLWNKKGRDKQHLVEDLLNRTVFYKVSHHLSYNGTSLEGLKHLTHPDLAAMATLDRNRISSRWKNTMPNPYLLKELTQRCKGKLFIMDETEVDPPPSKTLDPSSLGKPVYNEGKNPTTQKALYKEYSINI